MTIPSRSDKSDAMMRAAAVDLLRNKYGVPLPLKQRSSEHISAAIASVEAGLGSNEPMTLIRAFVSLRDEGLVRAATPEPFRPMCSYLSILGQNAQRAIQSQPSMMTLSAGNPHAS